MCLVSIIIPVYNTGEILYQTLDSVANQTYRNIEVFLVDDGSTDNTPDICISYVKNDSRFHYYKKENGGICSARNYGLKLTSGEYVYFADHDDILDIHLVEISLKSLLDSKADLVKFGVVLFNELNKEKSIRRIPNCRILSCDNLSDDVVNDINKDFYSNIWDAMFRKSFLEVNRLEFDTSYTRGYEDIDFNFRMLCKVPKVHYITDVLYTHYVRKGTSTSSKRYPEILNNILDNPNRMSTLIDVYPEIRNMQKELCYYYMHNYLISSISYSKSLNSDKSILISHLRKKHSDILSVLYNVNLLSLTGYAYTIGGVKFLLMPILYLLYKYKAFRLLYSLIGLKSNNAKV